MLGVKVLVRAGACRPREELERSFTSQPPLDLDQRLDLWAKLVSSVLRRNHRNNGIHCVFVGEEGDWELMRV